MSDTRHTTPYATNMTSNNAPAPFAATASQNAWGAFRAFSDNLDDDLTFTGLSAGTEQWVQIQLDVPIRIWAFRVACRTSVSVKDSGQVPKNLSVQGSEDGSTFETIQTYTNTGWEQFTSWDIANLRYDWSDAKEIEINCTKEYMYYRFVFGECQSISTQKTGPMTPTPSNTVKLTRIQIYQSEGTTETYTVTFQDWDGTTLSVETVEDGAGVTPPDIPVREGYLFSGWDKDFSIVTENMTITAVYRMWILIDGNLTIASAFDMSTNTVPADYPWHEQRGMIEGVVLLEGVGSISGYAFAECIALTEITIPESVTIVGCFAFAGCAALAEVSVPGNVASIGEAAFERCTSLISISLLNKEVEIYDSPLTLALSAAIYGYRDSTAKTYAEKYSRTFVQFDGYTVIFADWDGTTLKTQMVRYGEAATAPRPPAREGYVFEAWDAPFDNIISDTVINAIYDFAAIVTVSPSQISLVQGETAELTFFLEPDGLLHTEVVWSCSNPGIAAFDENSLVISGVSPGVATITATHQKQQVSASCNVTVLAYGGISEDYKEAIRTNNRGIWDASIAMEGTLIPKEDIVRLKITEVEFKESKLGIGGVVSSYVEITLRNRGVKFLNKSLTFKIGMMVKGKVEYVPFGLFYVTDSEGGEEDETIEITAYDSIKKTEKSYTTALKYPAALADVARESAASCGLETSPGIIFPDIQITSAIKAETHKDALAVVAQLMGCNAVANRLSQVDFRFFNRTDIVIDAANRYYSFKRKDMDSYVRSVKIVNDDGTFIASGASRTDDADRNALDISIINSYGSQSIAEQILSKIAVTYRAGELEFLGDPSVQVGDIITVRGKDGKEFIYPIMENIIEYDGGVKNSTKSYSESEEEQEFVSSKKNEEDRLNDMESKVDDLDEVIYGTLDPDTGAFSGGLLGNEDWPEIRDGLGVFEQNYSDFQTNYDNFLNTYKEVNGINVGDSQFNVTFTDGTVSTYDYEVDTQGRISSITKVVG